MAVMVGIFLFRFTTLGGGETGRRQNSFHFVASFVYSMHILPTCILYIVSLLSYCEELLNNTFRHSESQIQMCAPRNPLSHFLHRSCGAN